MKFLRYAFISLLLATASMAVTPDAYAAKAKISVEDGSIKGMLAHKKVLTEYRYDDLIVGKKSEAEYVAEKVADKNGKEAGAGDTWAAAWESDRAGRFQPKFEELLTKYLGEQGVSFSSAEAAPDAVMLVHVTRIEPGFYVGVAARPSYVDMMIEVVDPADRSKVLAVISLRNAPGDHMDTGTRIAASYAKAGKDLAKYLEKKGQ